MTPDEVARLALAAVQSFPQLLQVLHDSQYTGAITLHCHRGVPQTAEFPPVKPPTVQVPLQRKVARRDLTTGGRKPHSSR